MVLQSLLIAAAFSVQWNGTELIQSDARISAVPFNRVWTGRQRTLDQTRMSKFVTFDTATGGELAVTFPDGLPRTEIFPLSLRPLLRREGNALRIVYSNREPDTTRSAALMAAKCRELGIEDCRAMADVCGIGLVIKQHAQKVHDFIFRDFNGGEPADDKEHYVNRNIEAWSFFRRSLEMGQVCFPDGLDADAVNQLCNRMLQWNAAGKMMCERKEDMKKRGVHSPDRADALVMAWWAGRHMRYEGEEVMPMVPNVDYIERGDIMPANFDL